MAERSTPYDQNNIFARILSGELPAHRVAEDAHTLAIMDIMPRAPGHALVLPKTPSRNILDISDDDLAHVYRMVRRLARAMMRAFAADGVTIQQFNEPAGGQVVFHTHVHVIPRHANVSLGPHTGQMEAEDVLGANAEKLRAALAAP